MLKIEGFKELEPEWNSYDIDPPVQSLIEEVKSLVAMLLTSCGGPERTDLEVFCGNKIVSIRYSLQDSTYLIKISLVSSKT